MLYSKYCVHSNYGAEDFSSVVRIQLRCPKWLEEAMNLLSSLSISSTESCGRRECITVGELLNACVSENISTEIVKSGVIELIEVLIYAGYIRDIGSPEKRQTKDTKRKRTENTENKPKKSKKEREM